MSTTNTKYIPKDAQVIMAIMKEIGIDDFDPRVITQLLEFIYWHTTIILDDARVFANHAKKKNIDVDDVKLAIQLHAEKMTSAGPPRDILLELARNKNSTSLAPFKPQSGIRLPPDRYCLTQPNYRLKTRVISAAKKNPVSSNVSSSSFNVTGNVITSVQPTEMKFSTTPVLKQMPTIPRTTASSPGFMSKCDILTDTSSSNEILIEESIVRDNPTETT